MTARWWKQLVTLICGCCLSAHALSQQAGSVNVDALRQEVEQTQRQLKETQQRLQQMQNQLERLQQQQNSSASQMQQNAPPATGPAVVASTPEPSASAAPSASFMAGPVKITPGGFVELMVISRDHNESADWASNFNTGIPYPNSHNYYLSELHLSERQSRVQSLFQGPESDSWAPEGYLEADFGGAGATGNYNESSSFSPRVRHYFADVTYKPLGGTLLFGQTWSLLTGFKTGLTPRQENIPLTIDGQYLPGFDWLRLPQIRLTEKFNDLLAAAVSLENPAAQITSNASSGAPALPVMFNNPGATNSFSPTNGAGGCTTTAPGATCTVTGGALNNVATDYLPDVIVKVALDPGFGHFEGFATERFFRDRVTTSALQVNQRTNATGFGGNMLLPIVPKMLDFQASIIAGRAVGRYGSAQLPDATVNAGNLEIEPLRGFHTLAGLQFRPVPLLTLFGYVGEEQADRSASFRVSSGKRYGYGYGNPLFDNSGCGKEGASACAANTARIISGTLGGWWKFYRGFLGYAQVGLTDTWIKREIYSGIGGDPSTYINIALLSFRYYPFQK